MQPGEEFLCHGNGSPDETLSICLAQENCEMPDSVRQWALVAIVKRHPCTSTDERQLTDWREQVTTCRDLRGLLYSHSDIVCFLIQSNCIELQPQIFFLDGLHDFSITLYKNSLIQFVCDISKIIPDTVRNVRK
jgi:hypothetical protein